MSHDQRLGRFRVLFGLCCVAALSGEACVVFVDRGSVFGIEGSEAYEIASFASGQPVAHAFLMRGDGLQAVSVRVSSSHRTTARIQWVLWRGSPERPAEMTRAFEDVESMDLRPGPQWKTFGFTRDGSSGDRWYTFEARLLDAAPPPAPQVRLVASSDNPDRGGVLFVNGDHKDGSLFIRAEARGRTLYREFLANAAPNLPELLRVPAVQWAIVIVLHWSLALFAYTVLADARRHAVGSGPR